MNFKWLTDGIDTPLAFWLLGIGLLVWGRVDTGPHRVWLSARGEPEGHHAAGADIATLNASGEAVP
jgi:hypothetical protein